MSAKKLIQIDGKLNRINFNIMAGGPKFMAVRKLIFVVVIDKNLPFDLERTFVNNVPDEAL